MSAFTRAPGRARAWRVFLAAGASVVAAGVGTLGAPAACGDCVKAHPDLSSFPERTFDGGLGGANLDKEAGVSDRLHLLLGQTTPITPCVANLRMKRREGAQ